MRRSRPGGGSDPAASPDGLQGEEDVEFEDDRPVPAGDEGWPDLGDADLLACRATGREPVIRDADAEDASGDGE